MLCIDETGDQKYGTATDYVSRRYIGNLGTVETGLVSVNAYSIIDDAAFPLLFQVFKPDRRLKPDDTHQTNPAVASTIVRTLVEAGFALQLVLADALYGESGPFLQTLGELGISFVVAIRHNPMGCGSPKDNRFVRIDGCPGSACSATGPAKRAIFEKWCMASAGGLAIYYRTSDPDKLLTATTRFVMTNLSEPV